MTEVEAARIRANKLKEQNNTDKSEDQVGDQQDSKVSENAANFSKGYKSAPSGSNEFQQAGSGLMMTGNAPAMAVGAGMMTYGSVQQKKEAEATQDYNNRVSKLNREQNAYSALANLAARFKSL